MKITSLIDSLISAHIKVQLKEGELQVTGPKESLTPEILDMIKKYKEELVKYFQSSASFDYLSSALPLGNRAPIPLVPSDQKPLDFSLFYFGNAVNHDDTTKYKLLIESAKYADCNDYTAVWTPERHFNEFGGLYPSPSVLGAAIAMVTKKIQIRAGSVVIPLHHPLRIAEEWAVVDNLSAGRVGISCAPGWQSNDFVLSPNLYKNRHEKMYQSIESIQKLWQGEPLLLEDGNGVIKDTRIFPRPIQKELPMWITSRGSIETFQSAGKLGLNILTHLLGETVAELAVKIKAYRGAYAENQHPVGGGKVVLMLHTYIGADREQAYEKARVPFINYLRTSLGLIRNAAISWGYDIDAENFTSEDLDDLLNYSFYRYVSNSSLVGSKEDAMNMLKQVSQIGVDEIACLIDFGVEFDATMQGLQLLTEVKETYNLNQQRKKETVVIDPVS